MNYRFEILGPATVVSDGEDVVLPSTKPSAILASLLLKCNSFVSLDYLKYALWGEEAPANADVTLPTYILRLRRLLRKYDRDADPITTMPRGYSINLPANSDSLDLLVFRRLAEKGASYRSSGEMENERSALVRAEKLWKGPALSNIPSETLHREETPSLNDQWFDVLERRFTIDLTLGDFEGLAPQVRQAITHRPERERYWEQLIEALYRSGRTTEALNEYRKVHEYLTSELGIEPRQSLQEIHLQVLRQADLMSPPNGTGETATLAPRGPRPSDGRAPVPPSGKVPVPRRSGPNHLPLAPDFFGRCETVESLVEEVVDTDTPVVVVTGPPSVGKTEMALRTAKRCEGRFSGGVYLARFDRPDGSRRDRSAILCDLLRQAGVDLGPEAGRTTHEAPLLNAWQSVVADRPCLVVIDGVRHSVESVPLLPPSSESRVIITSRNALPRLIAFHGARTHSLAPLHRTHAVRLLSHIIGEEAEDQEPAVLQRIADACGGLPGAVRLAGAKFVSTPHLTLDQFATLLEASPLEQLSAASESEFSLREEILYCFDKVSRSAQRLFLDLAADEQQGVAARELYAGFPGTTTEFDQALGELYDASLIHHCGTDRIGVYRLLREVVITARAPLVLAEETGG
ncbi:AfsR/SARP family transcriptional regulator [Nocardiopsis xinjiangensis]|uniref:AfsR/SARP family transcriptional regulator n=1 Tax=Nocardiopsis xinjiangensis TaxID=124285 RepID=UPI0003662B8B|nr:BTAD domain-containing putative transcriptional regulator [Nocardiopsis xinjiangensis]